MRVARFRSPSRRPFLRVFPVLLASALAVPHAVARDAASQPDPLREIEALLRVGDPIRADSLWMSLPEPRRRDGTHEAMVVDARLSASRGDWQGAERKLQAWLNAPERTGRTGDVYFWMGWAALHQGRLAAADSLLVLASAHAGESRAGDALEYRFAALLEQGDALQDYLRGLPESPLPANLRRGALSRVPATSRLYPHALWELAGIARAEGRRDEFVHFMQQLSPLPGPYGRRASAMLAFLQESGSPDISILHYENLLFQQQNGVQAEFSRERLQQLRGRNSR